MIQAHPLWGTGTGTFREAYPIHQRRFFQDPASAPWVPKVAAAWKDNYNATVEAPHNEYLHIAAETGWVGILLYFVFVGLLLKGSISRRAIPHPMWTNGCAAGCFAILVTSFFGFPLHLPSTGLVFAMMAGLLLPHREIPSGEIEGERKGDPLFGTLLVLVACLALLQLIYQGKVFASGRHLYQAIGHQLSMKADRSLEELMEAKRLNPKDPEIDYWLGSVYLSLGRLDLAQDHLQRAKSSFNSPRMYLTLGSVLSDLRKLPEAEALYREGIETYPGLAPLHTGLGAFYGRSQRYEEAIQELVKAREIDPSLPETYHLLGHAFYRVGSNREAYQNLQHFLSLAPSSDPRRHLDSSLMRSLKAGIKSP
jgi:predicted Zn-dependent protease